MRAVLWDFDGTIADTTHQHFEAWKVCFQEYGIDHSFDDFIACFGMINSQIIPKFLPHLPSAEIAAFSKRKEAMYREILAETPNFQPLPGVMEWLVHFHEAKIPQAVASSGPMANIVAGVSALKMQDFFHALLTGYYLPEGKPHPAIFLHSAAALKVEASHCIVFEDSAAGVEAARRAGMSCVVVGELATSHNQGSSQKLQTLLERIPGRRSLPIGDLRRLTWNQVESLWREDD